MTHSIAWSRIALAVGIGATSAACMNNPSNGSTFGGATSTTTFTANGYHSVGGMDVAVQVQKNIAGSPDDDANWKTVATTKTSTVAENYNDPDHLAYAWTATVKPANGTTWTQGGLARARALANPNSTGPVKLTTFDQDDMATCIAGEISGGKSWLVAGNDCASPYAAPPILVSTTPTPADGASPPGYLTYTGQNADVGGYYTAINAPTYLSDFRTRYGFGQAGTDEVKAIYYNNGDLGLAREMHCKSWSTKAGTLVLSGGVACYVTNYAKRTAANAPDFGNDPQTGLNDAIAGNNPVATVAMVSQWSLLQTANLQPVTFMVFDGSGHITSSAPLDRVHANTSIPNNCLTCHGGSASYDPGSHKVTGATFLPFDPASFLYSTQAGYTQADQAQNLRKLNAFVMSTSPAAGVKDLVTGMYGGVAPSDPSATFTDAYVPASWSADKASTKLYQQVMKPYCRTCHIAQDAAAGGEPFASASDFTSIKSIIADFACSSHIMPHAEQTARRFWASPARAYLVNALGVNSACAP